MAINYLKEHLDDLLTKKITIGVTGFSRSGKTVFIGSLVQALLTSDAWASKRGQGPLAHFGPFERGQFLTAQIRSDIKSELPQFPFRKVRDSLIGEGASWPEPTTGISRLIIDCEYRSRGVVFKGARTIQLELVDFPGEWLIDLPMLELSYEEWSKRMLTIANSTSRKAWSSAFLAKLDVIALNQEFSEDLTADLAELWLTYMKLATENGFVLNQPGRLLRPDTMQHSPLLRLIPLHEKFRDNGLWKGMEKRFEEYKRKVIKPFYKNYFAKMDRQIVLVDILRSLKLGENVFSEMVDALSETLHSFHYGKGGLLSWLSGASTTHLLFSATKADHVTRGDRENLRQMLEKVLISIDDDKVLRSNLLKHLVLPIASFQATEDRKTTVPPIREILYGRPKNEEEPNSYDPGGLPLDYPIDWNAVDFEFYEFSPLKELSPNSFYEGFPSINMGKALDFLIGENFK